MNEPARVPSTAVFRVMPSETGWTVREDGGAATAYSSRREALQQAQRLAQARSAARVIVHYADSTVERQTLFHGEPRAARTWRKTD